MYTYMYIHIYICLYIYILELCGEDRGLFGGDIGLYCRGIRLFNGD